LSLAISFPLLSLQKSYLYGTFQMIFPALWKQLEKSLNIIEGLRGETDTVGSFLDAPSSVTTTLTPAEHAGVTDERGLDLTEGT
jgi:hypothetical protein